MGLSKWILGGLGWAIGGPIGALVGVVIASLFSGDDSKNANETFSDNARNQTADRFQISLLILLAAVIKADGKVLKSEIKFAKEFLLDYYEGDEQASKEALQILKTLLGQPIDHVGVAQQLRRYINYSQRLEIVHLLLGMANADGEFHASERTLIEVIAMNMGISPNDYQSILAPFQRQRDTNWAYKTLEIAPNATDDEVKKAYRRMAMRYHPDKVTSAGEEAKRAATERFRTINEAYEHIKKHRNMK